MENSINNLECNQCVRIIRPPFKICAAAHIVCPHCITHCSEQNIGTENSNSLDCNGTEREISYLNPIFKKVIESCQFECGYRSDVLRLQEHEDLCTNRPRLVYCLVKSCLQILEERELIYHVKINHPNQIIDNCQENTQIIQISTDNPVIMVLQYDISYIINEIYWIILTNSEEDKFISVQHIAHVGPPVEHAQLMEAFDVYASQTENILSNLKINKIRNDLIDLTTNVQGEYIGKRCYGVKIYTTNTTAIPESVFELECYVCYSKMQSPIRMCEVCAKKVKDCPSCKDPMTEARNYALEFLSINLEFMGNINNIKIEFTVIKCNICKMVMESPIQECSKGHSLCGSCIKSNTFCQTCMKLVTATRNYSLEGLIAKLILPCRYASLGCCIRVAQDNTESHIRKCLFRPISCKASCNWKGPYVNVKEHWQEKHTLLKNGVFYNMRILNTNLFSVSYLYEAYEELFIVIGNNFKDYTFFVCHLSNDVTSQYYFTANFVNEANGYSLLFLLPCGCASDVGDAYSETSKVQNVCRIPKELVHKMLKDRDQLKFKLTIYKK